LALALALLASSSAFAKTAAQPEGVVVVSLVSGDRGQEAGLRPGDVLLEARAQGTRLRLASPFDVWRAETDLASLRAVRLTVRRGAKTFRVTLPESEWGLEVRPVLGTAEAAQWDAALGAAEDTLAQSLSQKFVEKGAPLSAAWLWFRRGAAQIKTQRFEPAGRSFAKAQALAAASQVKDAPEILFAATGDVAANVDNKLAEKARRGALAALVTPPIRRLVIASEQVSTLRYRQEIQEAQALLDETFPALEKLAHGRLALARALFAKGSLSLMLGKLDEAEAAYAKAISLRERLSPHSESLSKVLIARAMIARRHADLRGAQALAARALKVAPDLDGAARGVVENVLGIIAKDAGDYELAQLHYTRAVAAFAQGTGESVSTAGMLQNLGNLALLRHDYPEAERAARRSLAIREKLVPGSLDEAASLNQLGSLSQLQGRLDEADGYLRRSLAIKAKLAPGSLIYANALYNLGETALDRGLWKDAAALFHQAADLKRRFAPESGALAETLDGEARAVEGGGDVAGAQTLYAAAVAALEAQRGGLPGSEDQRAAFSSQWAGLYQHWAENLTRSKRFDDAFAVSERSHASGLLTLLAEKKVLPRNQAPPALLAKVAANDAAFDHAQAKLAHASGKSEEVVRALTARLSELRHTREQLNAEIRQSSPRLAALTDPRPLTAAKLRARLPEDVALVEFSVGKEKTLLFVLTRDGLTVHALPVGEPALTQKVKAFRSFIERGRTHRAPEAPLLVLGQSLFDTLLRPVLTDAPKAKRWVLVPDGPLHLLPFSALLVSAKPLTYLAQAKRLSLAPSATVWEQLRAQKPPATTQVISFGNPPHPPEPPLAQGQKEAITVAALFPGGEAHLGSGATEPTVLARAGKARYLHFATHARVDGAHALDSALLLATPATASADDNGLLQAWEVAQKLTLDASLVTLSGCDTGLGTVVAGEGLMGLSRAFQYAGARAVVVSLWEVADGPTAALMTHFYEGLRAGLFKDEALARAEDAVRAKPAFRHPYYWAAFQLNGDSRPDAW